MEGKSLSELRWNNVFQAFVAVVLVIDSPVARCYVLPACGCSNPNTQLPPGSQCLGISLEGSTAGSFSNTVVCDIN